MSRRSTPPPIPPIPPKPRPSNGIARKRRVLLDAKIQPRGGCLDASEKSTIENFAQGEIVPAQIDALAIALRREPGTIAKYVLAAKERFTQNASKYADLHMQSAEAGMREGSPKGLEVARKASEFAMQNVSAKDSDGKTIRIVESSGETSSAPIIKIGIALGGLPAVTRNDEE